MAKSILIVDDCRTTRRILGLYVKSLGFEPRESENGVEALEKLAQGPVDAILTDLNMPCMDGDTLIRELQGNPVLQSIPVIVITTESNDRERANSLAAGASGYMVKPVTQQQLAQELERVLAAQGV